MFKNAVAMNYRNTPSLLLSQPLIENCPFFNYTYFSILIAKCARKTPVSAQPDLSIDFNPLRPRQSTHRSDLKRANLPTVLCLLSTAGAHGLYEHCDHFERLKGSDYT
jgi:hypothetical protein